MACLPLRHHLSSRRGLYLAPLPSPNDVNRVKRNVHVVSPDKAQVGSGDVQALYPFAALVNHCCRPNSCFHAVATSSSRGPEVELVLRTVFEIRAGDELCVSYFPSFVETPAAVSA